MSAVSSVPLFEALSDAEQRLLDHLLGEADSATGVVHGFTFTRCSQELGLGRSAGRRTMGPWLQRLADLSLVEILTYPLGRRLGAVRINRANPRETARSNRAVQASQPRAEGPQPRAATARSRECHKEQDSQAVREVQEREGKGPNRALTSTPEPEPNPDRDWADHEFPDLVAPLVAACIGNPTLRGLDHPAGVIDPLRPFTRAQVAHAVDLVRRRAETGDCTSPFGLLRARALAADPVYFPADPLAATAAVADKWAEW